jgi:hypothetical protein
VAAAAGVDPGEDVSHWSATYQQPVL